MNSKGLTFMFNLNVIVSKNVVIAQLIKIVFLHSESVGVPDT